MGKVSRFISLLFSYQSVNQMHKEHIAFKFYLIPLFFLFKNENIIWKKLILFQPQSVSYPWFLHTGSQYCGKGSHGHSSSCWLANPASSPSLGKGNMTNNGLLAWWFYLILAIYNMALFHTLLPIHTMYSPISSHFLQNTHKRQTLGVPREQCIFCALSIVVSSVLCVILC